MSLVTTKRGAQCALATLVSFHGGILAVFVGAPGRISMGLFALFLFWLMAWIVVESQQ